MIVSDCVCVCVCSCVHVCVDMLVTLFVFLPHAHFSSLATCMRCGGCLPTDRSNDNFHK